MSGPHANPREIFLQAIEQYQPDEWPAFLDQQCSDNPDLRNQVEVLLKSHQELGTFQDDVRRTDDTRAEETSMSGSRIGRYKLLQSIGEGGMGTVFMAEQIHPVSFVPMICRCSILMF